MPYPEHEKINAVKDQSQTIGDFLDWIRREKGIVLANYGNSDVAWLAPDGTAKERLLAEYFEIDLDALEAEKRAMLQAAACVAANGAPSNREIQEQGEPHQRILEQGIADLFPRIRHLPPKQQLQRIEAYWREVFQLGEIT